jgi:hypothetical protein
MSKLLLPFLLVTAVFGSESATVEPFKLQRLSGPITIDGLSDEPAWQAVEPLPLTMFTPSFRGRQSERTEIRVTYDDNYLYVSGKLYDSDPEGVQGNSLVRDLDRGGDFLNLLLDTFNDNETLQAFVTTPAGNRLDAEISNDAEGSDFFNQNWNAFWDNAVVQTEEGWFAEMRIPFSSLRFQDDNGRVVFGMIVHRLIGRRYERLTFPPIEPKWATAQWKASQARDVMLEGIYRRKPVYLSPYLLGGLRQFERPGFDGPLQSRNDLDRDLGLDLKYGLTNNLSLDLTLNTDFAQVEADNEQANLTRFSLFFPEKRQFFQERSGIFSYKTGVVSRLFHSRRIGLTEDGESVRILGGARVVGRIGDWDVGVLNMQTARAHGRPSENFGVVRLRQRVLNEKSYVGGMVTNRVGDDGTYNFTYASDGNFNVFDSDYLVLKWAQTLQGFGGGESQKSLVDGSFLNLYYERRNEKGLGFFTEFRRSGQHFNPGIGFTLRDDFLLIRNAVSYGHFVSEESFVRKHAASVSSAIYLQNDNKAVESGLNSVSWNTELKSGHSAELKLQWRYENLQVPFEIGRDVAVPTGNYHFFTGKTSFLMSDGKRLRTNGAVEAGSFYDGHVLALSLSPTWIQSRYLELSAEYELNRIRFPERGEAFDSNILRLRILSAMNNKFSGNALIQYNSLDDTAGINARLRYNFSEGHDLYFVYNEVFSEDLQTNERLFKSVTNRTFLVKYIYTLIR